jgi:diguanylate cyclase (GGDEF)-like protein
MVPSDVVVLDISGFGSVASLRQAYLDLQTESPAPVLVIVDSIDEETAVLEWLSPEHDVCTREEAAQQLPLRTKRCLARTDQSRPIDRDLLTGLVNRPGLQHYFAMYRASHDTVSPLCVVSVELDRFKEVNDRYGHAAGDQILKEVGRLLEQSASGASIVSRVGGDDFVLIMPGSLDQGAAFAEVLRSRIEAQRFAIDGSAPIPITCSAGVAVAIGSMPLDDLLALADQCVYMAKRKGRNRVVTVRDFESMVDAAGQDALLADFENRIRVTAERLTGELVLKARRVSEQYRTEAEHDGLTGLFNRRYLDRFLSRELEKQSNADSPLCVALLDLDHFGDINETFGHPTGDRALRMAAAVLQSSVRAGDLVARYGGEEFCVVMCDTALQAASQVAERIRLALSAENISAFSGQPIHIRASIGVVEVARSDSSAEAVYQRASDKVREAKNSGRNQVRS